VELGLSAAAKSSGRMGSASVAERPASARSRGCRGGARAQRAHRAFALLLERRLLLEREAAHAFAERMATYELRRAQLFAQPAPPPRPYPFPGDPLHGLDRFSGQPRVGRDLPRVAQSSGPPRLLPLHSSWNPSAQSSDPTRVLPPGVLPSIDPLGFRALLWRPIAHHQSPF
jgi:hypothetical protein